MINSGRHHTIRVFFVRSAKTRARCLPVRELMQEALCASCHSHVLVLIRENIRAFEAQNGSITGDLPPADNVKPTAKA